MTVTVTVWLTFLLIFLAHWSFRLISAIFSQFNGESGGVWKSSYDVEYAPVSLLSDSALLSTQISLLAQHLF